MTQVTARIKKQGKGFEILVDMEKALNFRKGVSNNVDFLEADFIFSDMKKGERASEKDVLDAFKTEDVNEIASQIVKNGEVLTTQDYRDEETEKKMKQIVEFLTRNAVDPQTGNPHTADRIRSALEEARVNIKNLPIEQQIQDIMKAISAILPIKIETKKIKIIVPAVQTGKVYGVINEYKESENWLDNGDLEVIANIPAGMIMDFYDKLNSVTHGSVITEEIKTLEREE